MPWRRALGWILLFAVVAGAGSGWLERLGPGEKRDAEKGAHRRVEGRVTRTVDGDTVKVVVAGRTETVRYIGVDTPESRKPNSPIECFGKAAAAFNARLVDGQAVSLRMDAEPRDRFGRLLAYVHRRRDGLFVNAALVRAGFATALTIPPNVRFAQRFLGLEREARRAGRGLWAACR